MKAQRAKRPASSAHQLELGGVPEVFVRLPLLELLQGIRPLPRIVRVGFERVTRPSRRPREAVVVVWSVWEGKGLVRCTGPPRENRNVLSFVWQRRYW